MEVHTILLFFFFFLSDSSPVDTISANQEIKDGNTIVSDNQMYELGFFSPGNSKNRYVGIWYKKISTGTVVWVANRETPIADTSGTFKLTSGGTLLVLASGNTVMWSSNSTIFGRYPKISLLARLLDNGNLIVWDETKTTRNPSWQSFDHPGDTLLPGMKFGKDLVTGKERNLISWKTPDDPSPGLYLYWLETNGYPQIFSRQGLVLQMRVGPWNGLKFRGLPMDSPGIFKSSEFVVNEKEIYYKFEANDSVVQRVVVMPDGITVHLRWVEKLQDWEVYGNEAVDTCGRYGRCGPYGTCSINKYPPCSCMEGFEPRILEEWESDDWSGGCERKTELDCGSGDWFREVTGVKFPDTRRSWYNRSMTLGECETVCKRNCSCTAYATLDVRNGGSGCLLWFDELMDIREYVEDQVLFVRMAASELAGQMVSQSSLNKRKELLTVVLSATSAALFCVQ